MLPLSVPSYDEDRLQMSIGTISGVAQWTANTTSDWAKYAGGIHGTEDMSFLETYNLHMQADASFRQSAARTIETSLCADLDNPFYQYSFQGAYMGADFAYAAMIPFPKFDKAGKAIRGARTYFKSPTAAKTTNVAAKLSSQSASKSLNPTKIPKNAIRAIEDFFGGEGKMILNHHGDMILLRGSKKIRFDIKNSHGTKPHFHIEKQNAKGRWKDAGAEHRYFLKDK